MVSSVHNGNNVPTDECLLKDWDTMGHLPVDKLSSVQYLCMLIRCSGALTSLTCDSDR